jgi:hypothetical protein
MTYQVDLCYEIFTDTASDLDCCCEGHKIDKNEIGAVCRAYGEGWGGACTGFWWENLRERDHWGDPGVDGRIMLKWIFRKWDVGYGLD